MIALAKSVAQEMGPKGIRANAIAPGFIETRSEGLVSYSFVAGIAYPATPGDIRSLYTYTNYIGTITGTVSISTIDYIENNDGVLIVRYGKKTVGPGDYPYIMIQGGLYSCAKNKYG